MRRWKRRSWKEKWLVNWDLEGRGLWPLMPGIIPGLAATLRGELVDDPNTDLDGDQRQRSQIGGVAHRRPP